MDTANTVLFRSRFAEGSQFADRRLYKLFDGDTWIGNLAVHDDGTLFVSQNNGPAESWYGFDGAVAYVDKGRTVPGRGLRVVDGPA